MELDKVVWGLLLATFLFDFLNKSNSDPKSNKDMKSTGITFITLNFQYIIYINTGHVQTDLHNQNYDNSHSHSHDNSDSRSYVQPNKANHYHPEQMTVKDQGKELKVKYEQEQINTNNIPQRVKIHVQYW